MNYEQIIVELLGRIQVLEEQVAMLIQEKINQPSRKRIKLPPTIFVSIFLN